MPAAKYVARRRIRRGRFGLTPSFQVDRGYAYFLVVIDQQFGATIQLVGDIEQMFSQAVRRQAGQQRSARSRGVLQRVRLQE